MRWFILFPLVSLALLSTAQTSSKVSEISTVDTVAFESFTIRNVRTVTTEDSLYKVLGEPDSTFVFSGENLAEVRSFNPDGTLLSMDQIPKGGIPRAGIFYNGFNFTLTEGMAYLSNVFFSDSSIKVVTPEITLSEETTLEEVKQIFPHSYQPKGYGLRGACNSVEDIKGCELVRLGDYTYQGNTYPVPIWSVDLAFVGGKLAVMTANKRLRYD